MNHTTRFAVFLLPFLLVACSASPRLINDRVPAKQERNAALTTVSTVYVAPVTIAAGVNLGADRLALLRTELVGQLQNTGGVTTVEDDKKSAADSVFSLSIRSYTERAATEGAKIQVTAVLSSVQGAQIWTSGFSFDDKPLSDNLLAFNKSAGRSLSFASGEELQMAAIESLASDLARARNDSFLKR